MAPATERLNSALAGRYRIERELGTGGMATVYLAADLKHDRKVAIKVLKPELAAVLGAERFVVEIKTTAALSHPHILPLFDSGTADGFLFYVMPFIEGETIRDKLNRETQFGVDDAVRIAREVADALDYAHRHGVIHRDIKPENILLHDGRAMVMDFGIALAVSAAAGGRMTETGLSLGTPHYMSPEQATAEKEITPRSDVYSLASVLYEMLAGQPPHIGGAAQQIIMKIITETAQPVTALRKSVPANVSGALAKALEKLPADRFANAKEFADALGNQSFVTAHATPGAAAAARGWRRGVVPAVALGSAVIGFVIANFARSADLAPHTPVRFIVSAPPALSFNPSLTNAGLAISPDGRLVAYLAGPNRAVYVRAVDSLAGTLLPGTDNAQSLAFSPDGKWIAFGGGTGGGSVKKVPVGGGAVVPLGEVSATRGMSWGANDTIVVSTLFNLVAIPGAGGTPVPLTQFDTTTKSGLVGRWHPEVMPGGGVIFSGRAADATFHLALLDRKTGKDRVLTQIGSSPRWVSSGHVVYNADGALWALPFDPVRMEATGAPALVLAGVSTLGTGASNFAVARDAGTLVYAAGEAASSWLAWIDTLGRQQLVEGTASGVYRDPHFSPDGRTLAYSSGPHLFTYDIRRSVAVQITRDSVDNYAPIWTPDGKSIVFASTRAGRHSIYIHQVDASRPDSLLLTGRADLVDLRPMAITHDGSTLVVTRVPPSIKCWMGRVQMSGARDTDSADVVRGSVCNDMPALSPNGHWLAYSAINPGSIAVTSLVERFPEGGMRQQLSVGSGTFPLWSHDGRTAYYQSGDSMIAVSISATGTLNIGRPRLLFRADFTRVGAGRHNADVGPDGRFAVVLASAPAGTTAARTGAVASGSIVLVQDWAAGLKRAVARK